MTIEDQLKGIILSRYKSVRAFTTAAGIPYTTLDSAFKRGISNAGISTMIKVFTALDLDIKSIKDGTIKERKPTTGNELITAEEKAHIQKYRLLDPYGKEAVDGVLDVESRRCEEARAAALRKERGQMEAAQEIPDKIIQLRYKVPGYSVPMSAGTGQEAGQEYPEGYILVKEQPRGTSYIATVSGDSMEPTYHDGDKLFIRACEEIEIGQIGVFLMDGQQWVKERGDGVLISHNTNYDPIPMREDIKCQGLVLGVCDTSYFE